MVKSHYVIKFSLQFFHCLVFFVVIKEVEMAGFEPGHDKFELALNNVVHSVGH